MYVYICIHIQVYTYDYIYIYIYMYIFVCMCCCVSIYLCICAACVSLSVYTPTHTYTYTQVCVIYHKNIIPAHIRTHTHTDKDMRNIIDFKFVPWGNALVSSTDGIDTQYYNTTSSLTQILGQYQQVLKIFPHTYISVYIHTYTKSVVLNHW